MPRRKRTVKRIIAGKRGFQVKGVDELLENIENIISKTSGKDLKKAFMHAALFIKNQADENIDRLPISDNAKGVLKETVLASYTDPRNPYVVVSLSQKAAEKFATSQGIRYPNPYWFESGTQLRKTKKGASRGQMQETPFFRPAITTAKTKVKEALIYGFKNVLGKAAASIPHKPQTV